MFKKMGKAELGANEIRAAEQLSSNSAVVLWARGEIAEALGNEDRAVASYEAALALDSGLLPAKLGLTRLGGADSGNRYVVVSSREDGWQVLQKDGNFFARNAGVTSNLIIPLEVVSETTPEIVSWNERTVARRRIGILIFSQGVVSGKMADGEKTERIPIEGAVVIDVNGKSQLSSAPARFGEDLTAFAWSEARLTITAVDGIESVVALRPRAVAATAGARRPARQRRIGCRCRRHRAASGRVSLG
ncbi:MAG: hypothetical protein AAFR01_12975, partial [Pseudomonadota bacterium]